MSGQQESSVKVVVCVQLGKVLLLLALLLILLILLLQDWVWARAKEEVVRRVRKRRVVGWVKNISVVFLRWGI